MPKLVALQEVRYAAVNLKPGDEFDASDQDAVILRGIGKAKDSDKVVGTVAVETRDVKAEQGENLYDPTMPAEEKPLRRIYKRRDMRAED